MCDQNFTMLNVKVTCKDIAFMSVFGLVNNSDFWTVKCWSETYVHWCIINRRCVNHVKSQVWFSFKVKVISQHYTCTMYMKVNCGIISVMMKADFLLLIYLHCMCIIHVSNESRPWPCNLDLEQNHGMVIELIKLYFSKIQWLS